VILEIIVRGKPVSGNHATMPQVCGRTPQGAPIIRNIRTAESRVFDDKVSTIALAATLGIGWKIPDYVRCDVWVANIRMDRDNVIKELFDPMQGIVFHHDSRILDGRTIKLKDKGGPRVIVHVREVDGAKYGFRRPAKTRIRGAA
jgi:Holliday junction resolvase RusA-like endonuclease